MDQDLSLRFNGPNDRPSQVRLLTHPTCTAWSCVPVTELSLTHDRVVSRLPYRTHVPPLSNFVK
jgi:hypothetical protein